MSGKWKLVPVVGGKAVYDAMRAAGPSREAHFPGVVEPVLSRSDVAHMWRAAQDAAPRASEDEDVVNELGKLMADKIGHRMSEKCERLAVDVLAYLESRQ
jgi:hypothetical protein